MIRWFEIKYKDGSWTRTTAYSMVEAVANAKLEILWIEEVANGSGVKLEGIG